jgi:hypothetical protein
MIVRYDLTQTRGQPQARSYRTTRILAGSGAILAGFGFVGVAIANIIVNNYGLYNIPSGIIILLISGPILTGLFFLHFYIRPEVVAVSIDDERIEFEYAGGQRQAARWVMPKFHLSILHGGFASDRAKGVPEQFSLQLQSIRGRAYLTEDAYQELVQVARNRGMVVASAPYSRAPQWWTRTTIDHAGPMASTF